MRRLKNLLLAFALIAFGAALPIATSPVNDETPLTLQEKLAFGIENFVSRLPIGFAKAATLGAGYNFATNGALFVPHTSAMNFSGPLTVSVLITTSQLTSTTALINIIGNRFSGSSASGFVLYSDSGFSPQYPLGFLVEPTGTGSACGPGAACVRTSAINDGVQHHICAVFNGSNNTRLVIDGVDRDPNKNAAATFTNNTNYWTIGQANFPMILNDLGVFNLELSDAVCRSISTKAKNGQSLYSGASAQGLIAYYQMSDCVAGVCPDSSGNGTSGSGPSPANSDTVAPILAISPATGTQTGTVPLTTTCTDITGCPSVAYFIDNVPLGSSTTAPYTVNWLTANYADGPHVVTANAKNASGVVGTKQITLTTSNSVTNKTTKISGAGNDSTCSPGGTACATMQKANSFTYHGGDSILFDVANPISVSSITLGATNSTALIMAGPSAAVGGTYTIGPTSITQNVFGVGSGYPLTVGTYNGTGSCIPLSSVSTDCATITLSGNAISFGAPMVGVANLSYVTVQNLKIVGTGQALAGSQGFGIQFISSSGTNGVGVLIQNNEVIDFSTHIFYSATSNPGYPNFGVPCGGTIQNNYLHGSTVSYLGNGAGVATLNVNQCTSATGSILPGVTIVSNYTNNMGFAPINGGSGGDGIVMTNGSSNIIDSFNVTSNGGYNSPFCGSAYANWWYQVSGGTIQGNEGFGQAPGPAGPNYGCDNGAFDIDHDNFGLTVEYNYGHSVWGPAMALLDTPDGSFSTGGHVIRYNIFENAGRQVVDGTGAMVGSDWSAATASDNFYNNNIWNGQSGVVDPTTSRTSNPYAFAMQPAGFPKNGMVIANNIMVSNSANGGAVAGMVTYSQFNPGSLNPYLTWRNNAYYNVGTNSTSFWREINGGPGGTAGTTYSSYSAWAAAVGETGGINAVSPAFASPGGGTNAQCWTLGAGNPTACGPSGNLPGYKLTNPGSSAFIGTGLNLNSVFGLNVGTIDFYANSLGNGVGTGFNIGADDAHH